MFLLRLLHCRFCYCCCLFVLRRKKLSKNLMNIQGGKKWYENGFKLWAREKFMKRFMTRFSNYFQSPSDRKYSFVEYKSSSTIMFESFFFDWLLERAHLEWSFSNLNDQNFQFFTAHSTGNEIFEVRRLISLIITSVLKTPMRMVCFHPIFFVTLS